MEEEPVRLIKSGPKWLSGIQNGHKVKATRKQPFNFLIGSNETAADDGGTGNIDEVVVVGRPRIEKTEPVRVDEVVVNGKPTPHKKINGSLEEVEVVGRPRVERSKPVKVDEVVVQGRPEKRIKTSNSIEEVEVIGKPIVTKPEPEKTEEVRVVGRPIPEITLNRLKNTDLHELLEVSKNVKFTGYTMQIKSNGKLISSANTGDKHTASTLQLLNKVNPGELVIIEAITGIRDGREIKYPARIYRVVE